MLILLRVTIAHADTENQKNILLIHSYDEGLVWTVNMNNALISNFQSAGLNPVVHIEYMDSKSYYSPEYLALLAELFTYKYEEAELDLIISMDDNAFQFLQDLHPQLFPDIPAIFVGVNYLDTNQLQGKDWLTGIVESIDIRSTLKTALALHPKTETVTIINDQTPTGLANLKQVNQIIPNFSNQLAFHIISNLSMAELSNHVSTLQPDEDIILLLSYNRDASGHYYSYRDSADIISSAAQVPIYSVWGFYLEHGITGGKLISAETIADKAVEMALEILSGISPQAIPIRPESPSRYMFAYSKLREFSIPRSQVPENSIIINDPGNVFIHYWYLFVFPLLIIILFIILFKLRSRNTDTRLKYYQSEDRYRKLSEASFDGLLVHHDTEILDANMRAQEILGYDFEELLKMQITDFVHPDYEAMTLKKIREGSEYPYEVKLIKKDGAELWAEACAKNIIYNGKAARVAAFHDISLQKASREKVLDWLKFEQTASNVLSHFVDVSDIDHVINTSLQELGHYTGADRAYLFLFHSDGERMSNTHEWCADDVEPQMHNLKNMEVAFDPWWSNHILNGEPIYIENVSKLPLEASITKDVLSAQDIHSLIVVPLMVNKNPSGFVGFDNVRGDTKWKDEHIAILRLFAEVLGKVISGRNLKPKDME